MISSRIAPATPLKVTKPRDTTSKLIKPEYARVLSIIGCSPGPLSKYEIEERFAKEKRMPKQRHVYRMVRSLSGENDHNIRGLQDPLRFLEITLKEKNLNRIHELELRYNEKLDYNLENINEGRGIKGPWHDLTDEKKEAIREIDNLWDNNENRRYILGIRGLMLFILCESRSKVLGKKGRVKRVIQNPTNLDRLAFLKYWEEFLEVGFDVFDELEILAKEFQRDILDSNISNSRLVYKVVERYYISINGYFRHLEYGRMLNPEKWHEQFKRGVELQIWQKLKELNLSLLGIQRELMNEQMAYLDKEYERHIHLNPDMSSM